MNDLKPDIPRKTMFLAYFASGGLNAVELTVYNVLQFAELRKLRRFGALRSFYKALESQDVQECDSTSSEVDFIHFSRSQRTDSTSPSL